MPTGGPRHGALPVDTSSFIGRADELARIRECLARSRLVTLIGIGGIGKTRIALKVAAEHCGRPAGGVRLAQLGHLTDPALLPSALAAALGLPARSASWTTDAICEHLADGELLVLLDGCERAVEAVAAAADRILFTCPGVQVLVTSRRPLRLAYELRIPIPPLPVPPEDPPSWEKALESPALRLLVDRGKSWDPDLRQDAATLGALCGLCRRLDGIPLAIELAAGRLAAMGIEDILGLLDAQPLRAIDGAGQAGGQALEGTIRWSYDHLSEPERTLWRRLCVFAGSFDLRAVRRVLGQDEPEVDPIELVEGLVDKSMIRRLPGALRARFSILDTLRSFGLAELRREGEEAATKRRLLAWASSTTEDLQPEQALSTWVRGIQDEMANLRVALDFAAEHPGDAAAGLEVCTNIWMYWRVHGPIEEGRRRIARLLELADCPAALRARARWITGALAVIQNELETGSRILSEARAIGAGIGDTGVVAWSTYYLGLAAYFKSELEPASELLEEARRLHLESGNRFGTAMALTLFGQVELARARFTRATGSLEQALSLIRMLDDRWVEAYVLWLLGLVTSKQGDHLAAERLIEQALAVQEELHDGAGLALCVEALAWIAAFQGEADRCARLLGAARRAWRSVSSQIEGPLRAEHDAAVRIALTRLGHQRYVRLEREGFEHALPGYRQVGPAGSGGAHPLTDRELEIARLVAGGLSNREIAVSLNVSKRTVDSHLDHIFAKVGVRGRVELTNWVRDRG
jgi:predicted ATPase/DNA-binding CsgD family transcriptional regulator